MQFSELVTAVSDVVKDESFTSTIIKALINEAVLKIATGDMIPGKYELTPPLPGLYQTGNVTTDATGFIALPADYNRNVEMVVNSEDEEIPIESSYKKFRRQYVEEAAGKVFKCAVNGAVLHYRDIPSVSETLTIHYYMEPGTLELDTDKPSEIPAVLHRKLIVGYVCKEIFGKIEMGMVGSKVDTNFYSNMYGGGLIDLAKMIGLDEEPDYYDDTPDYCP